MALSSEAARTCLKCGAPHGGMTKSGLCPACLTGLGKRVWTFSQEGTDAERADTGNFGAYEIVEEIGRGGMGVVYRARQLELNREIALKMIRDSRLTTPEASNRFRIEAETAARLDHPNIVPIHDIGEVDGQLFYTMKLIDGQDLAAALREGRFRGKPEDATHLVAKIARAVDHAHRQGILHRDIKPGNILIDSEGEPHLFDFGLAKLLDANSGFTHTSDVMGSPAYMAPEQIRGGVGESMVASDIYALGAVMYETLTGNPPFSGSTGLEIMHRIATEPPARFSSVFQGLDRDLETICLKCLEKDSAQRYESAAALADDVERWRRGEPVAARPAGPAERLRSWCRRNPALALLSGSLALSIIAGSVAVLVLWQKERRERMAAEDHLYVADMRGIGQALENYEIGLARMLAQRLLTKYAATKHPAPWEWRVVRRQLEDKSAQTFFDHASRIHGTAFLQDGRLMSASLEGKVVVHDPVRGEAVDRFEPTRSLASASCALAAPRIVIADDWSKRLRVFDATTWNEIASVPAELDAINVGRTAALFPDGRRLLHSRSSGLSLRSLEPGESAVESRLSLHSETGSAAVSPDGKTIAAFFAGDSAARPGRLRLLHDETGEWTEPPDGWPSRWKSIDSPAPKDRFTSCSLTFSRDSSLLAASVEGQIFVVEIAGGTATESRQAHPKAHTVKALAFTSSGNLLVSGGTDQILRLHRVVWSGHDEADPPGPRAWIEPLGEWPGHNASISHIACNAAGTQLATAAKDGEVKLWNLAGMPQGPASFPRSSRILPRRCKERFRTGSPHFLTIEAGHSETLVHLRAIAGGKSISRIAVRDAQVADALLLDAFTDGNGLKARAVLLLALPPESPNGPERRRVEVWDFQRGQLPVAFPEFVDAHPLPNAFDYPVMARVAATNRLTILAGLAGVLPWGKDRHPAALHHFNLATGAVVRTPDELELHFGLACGSFSHDGTRLVLGGHDGDLLAVDSENASGRQLLPERHHAFVSQIGFSADDKIIASVSEGLVLLWDTSTWNVIDRIPSLDQSLRAVAFHPEEPRLAIGGSTGNAILWDISGRRQVAALAPLTTLEEGSSLFRLQFCGPGGDVLAGWIHPGTWLPEEAQVVFWSP